MDFQPENNLVGPAGIEPATVGLEIVGPTALALYSSVFSAPCIFSMVHSVTFGDDLFRRVGHDFGHDFNGYHAQTRQMSGVEKRRSDFSLPVVVGQVFT
jgi:hypothetical protein